MILHTYYGLKNTTNTRAAADKFALLLSVDKGYSCKITRIPGGHRAMASDGRGVDFLRHSAP